MKRLLLMLWVPVLLLCTTACGLRTFSIPESTLIPGAAVVLPAAVPSGTEVEQRDKATVWFRFLNTPYLAPEDRAIVRTSGQSFETALLETLFSGPGTQHPELGGLFPEGVRVRSAVLQGRTLLVTVSAEFTGRLRDEPVDWQENTAWRVEVPLRRRLAMQALVATVTENCDADEVLVLVEQPGDGTPQRLRQNWFEDDSEDDVLARPQRRDDALLLTPMGTARVIAELYTVRDWERLYRFVSGADPAAGDSAGYRSFVAAMEAGPDLVSAWCSGCNVTLDGQEATATVNLAWTGPDGTERRTDARVFRMQRENGVWKIGMDQLTGWVEE